MANLIARTVIVGFEEYFAVFNLSFVCNEGERRSFMTHGTITGKKVAIVATDYFEEIELLGPMLALRDAGVLVDVVAPHGGEIKGVKHVKSGQAVKVNVTLDAAKPADYDAVIVPGGVVNADHLRMETSAQEFVRSMIAAKKPTAVICHGPWLLVSADLIRGRKVTSYYTLQDDIRNAGGQWTDEALVRDGCLLTSRKPDDLPIFNQAILDSLAELS